MGKPKGFLGLTVKLTQLCKQEGSLKGAELWFGGDSWEPLGCREIHQSILRRPVLGVHWKDWCWSWSSSTLATWCEELTHWKWPWCWEGLGQEEKGTAEDEMVGWHHRLNGHGFWWTPGVGDGPGGQACCSLWGRKESDTTEWLNCLWKVSLCVQPRYPFLLRAVCVHAARPNVSSALLTPRGASV